MASPISFPTINGTRHAWQSIEAKIAGQIFYIRSANWSRKRTRTLVRLNHPDPVAKTRGSNEYSCDGEMLMAEFNGLVQALIVQANNAGLNGGYGDVFFQVVLQWNENGFDTVTVTADGCTLDETSNNNTEGNDPTMIKVDFAPLKITVQGQDDLAIPLVAPPGG